MIMRHTGTFFCEMTTAQSFPLTPIEVMFAAVMALKAYSTHRERPVMNELPLPLTDLVQSTLIREDGDMTVIHGT